MSEEWFDQVDPEGRVIGRVRRSDCHGNPALLHRAVHVFVIHPDRRRLFLQKRSRNKDVQPGKWDTSVGGHVDAGEEPDAAAVRELREELGVTGPTPEFLYHTLWRSPVESERIHSYRVIAGGPFTLHPEELEDGRFWTVPDIEAALGAGRFTPNFESEWPRARDILFPASP